MNQDNQKAKLTTAMNLYLEGIRDGNAKEALDKYTGNRYTQHSTGVGDGKQGFLDFFLPFLERNPDRDIRVVRSIVDGANVFCHVYQSLNQGESKWVTMDMFDTDSNNQIIEHWDAIDAYQEESVSGNDMVGGETEITDLQDTEANKELVKEYVKQVLTERCYEKVPEFIATDLIQHNPALADGSNAIQQALKDGVLGEYEMLFKLIGQGNFVVTQGRAHKSGKDLVVFDIYRVSDKQIVEHWSLREQILPREQWGNSGKF